MTRQNAGVRLGEWLLNRIKIFYKEVDKPIYILSHLLMVIGILMVYTASSYKAISEGDAATAYMFRQLLFVVIGLGLIFFLGQMNIAIFRRKKWMYGLLLAMVLAMALVWTIGPTINGAKGWLRIGGFSIQPIEFAKPIVVVVLANLLAVHQEELVAGDLWHVIKSESKVSIALALILGITFFLPDFGGMAIVASIIALMILASGAPAKWFKRSLLGIGVGYVIMLIILHFFDFSHIDNYQIRRFTAFANPFAYAQGDGLQLVNSYYAFALGGLMGQGPGNSIQKTGYIPEAHNDFIMAIIGEEFGFFVTLLIIAIYFALIIYLLMKSTKMRTIFLQLILVGVAGYFFVQIFINLGGVLGLIPITGVTLPFLSYGGSSVLASSIMIGLALAAIRRDQRERQEPTNIKDYQ